MDIEKLKLWEFQNKNNKHNIIINDKFVFIQIPKTSSTVIFNICHQNNLTISLNCYRHEGLLYLENFIKNNIPIYTIVRNPFSHIYSYFFHKLNLNEVELDQNLNLIQNFENFVRIYVNNIHLRQCDYLKSNMGNKVKIFKYENLNIYNYLCSNKITNKNEIDIYKKKDIKSFFINKEIVDLIIKNRINEFKIFNYSTDINDIIII